MAKPARRPRIDPRSRPPDGARPWDKLVNADPDRHYVYVDPNSEMYGTDFYESIGYEQEVRTEGGVRPAVGKTKGDSGNAITVMHQILMSCPLEVKADLDRFGVGGSGGQERIDKIERKILKPGGIDGLRGMHGYFDVVDETSAPRVEVERG